MTTEKDVKATGLIADKGIEFLSWSTPNGTSYLNCCSYSRF